jgi:hypothetical protein
MLDFQGSCTYLLTRDELHSEVFFEISALNQHRGTDDIVTVQEKIIVVLYDPELLEHYELTFHRDDIIRKDGVDISVPATVAEGVNIDIFGKGILLSTNFGIWMTWDFNNRVQIGISEEYRNHVVGICGNCDGDSSNDLNMPDGTLAENQIELGNAWKLEETCPDAPNLVPCTSAMMDPYTDAQSCGMIVDEAGPFASCIDQIDRQVGEDFYDSCLYDMCYTPPSGQDRALCSNLGAFYDECRDLGIVGITFRSEAFCAYTCHNNAVYNEEVSACQNSCVDPDAEDSCFDPPMEGCACLDGFIRSDTECVNQDTGCGCIDQNNAYHPLNTHWTVLGCGVVCMCVHTDDIQCFEYGCQPGQDCEILYGGPECVGDVVLPIDDSFEECELVEGECLTSCTDNNQLTLPLLAFDPLLCSSGLHCCLKVEYLCSTSHFGGFCSSECNVAMNSLDDTALCPNGGICCKPMFVRGEGMIIPVPQIQDGVLVVEAPPPGELPPIQSGDAIGPPAEGEATSAVLIVSGDSVGGVPIPSWPTNGDGGGAGEVGDPVITPLGPEPKKYKFLGKACTYFLMKKEDNPKVSILSHHIKAFHNGADATAVGSITVEYKHHKVLKLLEGNKVTVDGVDVTADIETDAHSFDNGAFTLRWNNHRHHFVYAVFGNDFEVRWNGYAGHVNVLTEMTGLSGLLSPIDGEIPGPDDFLEGCHND